MTMVIAIMESEKMRDYIPREDAIMVAGDMLSSHTRMTCEDGEGVAREYFKSIPSTDIRENVRGEWIDRGKDMTIRWQCSECGRKDTHIYNFCPNCGAQMEK